MIRRRYSDDDRAAALAALAANGGNVQRTATQLGIPEGTLRSWANGTAHPEAAKLCEQKKAPLADHLERIAHQLADALPGKLPQMEGQQVAVSLGILVDKVRLLRDQPTSISGQPLSDAERAARIRALVEEFRAAAGDGRGPDGPEAPLAAAAGEPPAAPGL